jgi:hypothetical protein
MAPGSQKGYLFLEQELLLRDSNFGRWKGDIQRSRERRMCRLVVSKACYGISELLGGKGALIQLLLACFQSFIQ